MKKKQIVVLGLLVLVAMLTIAGSVIPGTVNPNREPDRFTQKLKAVPDGIFNQSADINEGSKVDCPVNGSLPPEICECLYNGDCPDVPEEKKPEGWDNTPVVPTPIPTIENCPANGDLPPEICDCVVNGNCPDPPEIDYPPGYTPEP